MEKLASVQEKAPSISMMFIWYLLICSTTSSKVPLTGFSQDKQMRIFYAMLTDDALNGNVFYRID